MLIVCFGGQKTFSQVISPRKTTDTSKNDFSLKEKNRLGIKPLSSPFNPIPSNVTREVEYDAVNKRYIIRQLAGGRQIALPQYLTIEEYQRLVSSEIKRDNWRLLSNQEVEEVRRTGIIPSLKVNSKAFERIFGGTTIDIQPRGEAELTFLGRINKNENPL